MSKIEQAHAPLYESKRSQLLVLELHSWFFFFFSFLFCWKGWGGGPTPNRIIQLKQQDIVIVDKGTFGSKDGTPQCPWDDDFLTCFCGFGAYRCVSDQIGPENP